MADPLSVIPSAVLRNLSDKLYEKRKNAALEVEGIVKQLVVSGDHEKINAVINLLANEYAYSPQANHRKGGLIGLAAATVALTSDAAQHLEETQKVELAKLLPVQIKQAIRQKMAKKVMLYLLQDAGNASGPLYLNGLNKMRGIFSSKPSF